jgi:hypothetical protein
VKLRVGHRDRRRKMGAFMKKLAFAMLLAAASTQHAQAEMVDMSTITCAQLGTMNEDDGSLFLIWLDGWLAGQADATTLDVDDLTSQIDGIAKECEASPELSVMNAAKNYLEE